MSSEEEVGLDYWTQWQVFVSALIIIAPAVAAVVVIFRSREDRLKSTDLWIPCWKRVHPLWLLVYRGIVVLIMSWLLFQMILLDKSFTFYFYTQWTFALVIIYFAIAMLISARGCWIYSRQQVTEIEEANGLMGKDIVQDGHATSTFSEKNSDPIRLQRQDEKAVNEKGAGFLGYLMQIVYQTSAGASMLTDIVFWGLLVPFMSSEHFVVSTIMACMHSLNLVFLVMDTALNKLPFPWFRMAYFVLWSCIYVLFQWVLHARGLTWWPYPFFELATPWAPLWYFGMALGHLPCFGLYWLTVKAKNSLFSKFFSHAFIRSC